MEDLALYLLKSALCITIFLGVYWCFLKNETFFRFNRYFLVAGLICAILLPFYTYTYELKINAAVSQASPDFAIPIVGQENFFVYYLAVVYALIACFLLGRHVFGLLKIKRVVARSGYRAIEDCRLVSTPEFKSSFSVFNYIFFDTSETLSDAEKEMILKHEMTHVNQRHWADLLLAQLLCTLQWFNPLAWWYLKAIRQNHEFLADEAVLQQGNSVAGYRAVLVNHYVGTRVFAISSSFIGFPQQRIKMLAKPASGGIRKIAVLIVFPAVAIFIWAFSEAKVIITPPTVLVKHTAPVPVKTAVPILSEGETIPVPKKKVLSSADKKKTISPKETIIKEVLVKEPEIALPVEGQNPPPVLASAPPVVKEEVTTVQAKPLYFLNGKEVTGDINSIDPNNIASIHVLKDQKAVESYGERGKNGAILIYTKK